MIFLNPSRFSFLPGIYIYFWLSDFSESCSENMKMLLKLVAFTVLNTKKMASDDF